MDVFQVMLELGKALWSLKAMYDQHSDNRAEIVELQSFIQDYELHIPALQERFQKGGDNVVAMAAFKSLEKDIREVIEKLQRWSKDKSFFRLFNSANRMQKLGKLHGKVMACVQRSLGIASVSMLLDLQATQLDLQASQATILESNVELKSLLISSIESIQGTLQVEVRDEVVEASTSSFGDAKFWADILAAIDNHDGVSSSDVEKSAYEDPITANLMIDPIVASDGNTYCRWTIIDNNLKKSPFNTNEDLTIVVDNLAMRRGLFEKFPDQFRLFRDRRHEFRSRALSLKCEGLLGDAASALQYVIQWDNRDVECVEALEQVQGGLALAKKKYVRASTGPSSEPVASIGWSMPTSWFKLPSWLKLPSPIIVEAPISLDEAYKLVPELSCNTIEVRHCALNGICQWSTKDVNFQRYIIANGGIGLLTSLLRPTDEIAQGQALSILLHLSSVKVEEHSIGDFKDSLGELALVLRDGSDEACEQAARIVFNLSLLHCGHINGSAVLRSLVNCIETRPFLVQQIAASTLNKLLDAGYPSKRNLWKLGLLNILFRMMVEQPPSFLDFGMPLLHELWGDTPFEGRVPLLFREVRELVPPLRWLDLVASEAALHQERAAVMLCYFVRRDPWYRQRANESGSQLKERLSKLVVTSHVEDLILKALRNEVPKIDYEFPKKRDWWSPT